MERQMAAGMDAERALRYATGAQGGLFSIFALVAIVLMLSPIARRVDRRGVLGLSLAGLAFLAASTAVIAAGGTLVTDSVAMILYGIGFGLLFPAAAGIVGIAALCRSVVERMASSTSRSTPDCRLARSLPPRWRCRRWGSSRSSPRRS